MKVKRCFALLAASIMAISATAMPALAGENNYAGNLTQYTIDTSKVGSFTLHKLIENDGNNVEANALVNTSENRTPVKDIEFSYLKVADIISVAEGGQIGTYFTNINADFRAALTAKGYNLDSTENSTKIDTINPQTGGVASTSTYWSTNQMEKALAYMINTVSTDTATSGEVDLNNILKSKGTAMTKTDAQGMTKAQNLPLGLYLVGETDITAHDGLDASGNPYTIERAAKNGELPIIESPASPFFVSVPTTNITTVNGNPAGTVWLYDEDVYPKDQTNEITKRIVDPDSENQALLRTSEDYQIGDVIKQVIWADVPKLQNGYTNPDVRGDSVIDTKTHKKFVITDTMTEGLSFDGVTKVALGNKLASDPTKNDDFRTFTTEFVKNTDYTVSETTNQDGTHTFSVTLTNAGLAKLDGITANSQIAVWFDSTLNSKAKIGTATENQNHPTLTWRNSNTSERTYDGNRVYDYTYELDITKTGLRDGSHSTFNVKRQHAQDDKSVSGDIVDVYFIEESAGIYHVYDKNANVHKDTDDSKKTKDLHPAADGTLKIKGFDSDRYTFTEIKTEEQSGDEKNLLKTSFDVQFTAAQRDDLDGNATAVATTPDNKTTDLTVTDGIAQLTVNNYKTIMLRTGGEGRVAGYIFGFSMLGAMTVAVMADRKRKRA